MSTKSSKGDPDQAGQSANEKKCPIHSVRIILERAKEPFLRAARNYTGWVHGGRTPQDRMADRPLEGKGQRKQDDEASEECLGGDRAGPGDVAAGRGGTGETRRR